jgi:hypothetical protein
MCSGRISVQERLGTCGIIIATMNNNKETSPNQEIFLKFTLKE